MHIAFDDRGRLWVTDLVEYPFPAGRRARPRDTRQVLDDFGPDGKARKITTFADDLNIPIGILPLPDGKRGARAHSIAATSWQLHDTDGDGKADRKEVLYSAFGYRDTHGMTNAFTLMLRRLGVRLPRLSPTSRR